MAKLAASTTRNSWEKETEKEQRRRESREKSRQRVKFETKREDRTTTNDHSRYHMNVQSPPSLSLQTHPTDQSPQSPQLQPQSLLWKEKILSIRDIFDEMELLAYSYPYLIDLKTNQILSEIKEKTELKLQFNSNENGTREEEEERDGGNVGKVVYDESDFPSLQDSPTVTPIIPTIPTPLSLPIEIHSQEKEIITHSSSLSHSLSLSLSSSSSHPHSQSFISIYDLLTDSYRAPFHPNHLSLLLSLKQIPLVKYGYNKKTHQMEEYIWRNPIDLLSYQQGGRLNELNYEKGGKLANWHVPFYGYCKDDQHSQSQSHLNETTVIDLSRKEARRVGCLLCDKLETLQLVRNTLVRHLKNHHRDYYSVYCPDDPLVTVTSSSITIPTTQLIHEGGIESSTKTKAIALYWEIILKQAALIYHDLLPFRIVCGDNLMSYSSLLNANAVLFSERKLLHFLLYSLYGPSLRYIKTSLLHQLSSLSTSLVLTIDDCVIPNTSFTAYACSISFIDHFWDRKQYFLGYIPPVTDWNEIITVLNEIFSIISNDEIYSSDCITFNISKSIQNNLTTRLTQSQFVTSAESLQSHLCDFFMNDLLIILAKAFLDNDLLRSSDAPPIPIPLSLSLSPSPTLIFALQKANSLIEYFNSNSEIIIQLYSCLDGMIPIPLEAVDWDNLITISSSLTSLLQMSVCIMNYFSRYVFNSSSNCVVESVSHLCPSDEDWKIWSEIVSLFEPIKTVSLLLQGKSDYSLSLVWYIVDWMVCIYEQTIEWEVISIETNQTIGRSVEMLSPLLQTFRLKLIAYLKETYLSDLLKKTQSKQYELLCLATYCDPRTKNFHFFRSISLNSINSLSLSQPISLDYPLLYQRDAKEFILNEMRNEICKLLEKFLLSKNSSEIGNGDGAGAGDGVDAVIENLILNGLPNLTDEVFNLFPNEYQTQTGRKRKSDEEISSDLFSSVMQSLSSETNPSDPSDQSFRPRESTEVPSHSLTSFQLAYLRERIDEYCRTEMMTYENEPMICLPHLIRQNDPLSYWRINEKKYPIISRLARRYLAIQNFMIYSSTLKAITSRLYSRKQNQMICPVPAPALFDAILFLHFNGILDYQLPDSVN